MTKTIFLASDHAGFDLKDQFKTYLTEKGYKVIDLGATDNVTSISYADQGKKLGDTINKEAKADEVGLAFCGTGIGISIALNRVNGIRAARVTSIEDARLAKAHNNANVLAMGGRQLKFAEAKKMFEEFEKTSFEKGRHQARIDSLD